MQKSRFVAKNGAPASYLCTVDNDGQNKLVCRPVAPVPVQNFYSPNRSPASYQQCDKGCSCAPSAIEAYARVVAVKFLNLVPIHVVNDFPPGGVQSMSTAQKEMFRAAMSQELSKCLGCHVGWKWGLASATPSTPGLGYTAPQYGEILKNTIIVGEQANIPWNFALTGVFETDLLCVVDGPLINALHAGSTPLDVANCIIGIYPAVELAAIGTALVLNPAGNADLTQAFGPASGGQGILEVTNIAGRAWLRARKMAKVPGKYRSLADWVNVLEGGVVVTDQLVRGVNPITDLSMVPRAPKHLTALKAMVLRIKSQGHYIEDCELMSPGSAIGLRVLNSSESAAGSYYTTTHVNLNPKGPVTLTLNIDPNASCLL